jgi:hypothetical protein
MPLCIICETEKPDTEFKVRRGKPATECNDCLAALKPKRTQKERTFVQALLDAPEQKAPAIKGSSEERLQQAIEIRMEFYKSNALEALYDLAMMPLEGANSATLQVKYLAACRLAGPAPEPGTVRPDNAIAGVLAELDERYKQQAPRIREIRERVVVMDNAPINGAAIEATQ